MDWIERLSGSISGTVERDAPLAANSTFRIGGRADVILHPGCPEDVVAAMGIVADEKMRWMVFGLGSNVLFSDAGFRGLLIKPGRALASCVQSPETPTDWYVGAGLPLPILARRTARAGFGGIHGLIGVPGALGGGVAMNAGAHGQDLASVTRSVDLVNGNGEVVTLDHSEIDWQYRNSNLGKVVVVGAGLRLVAADRRKLDDDIRANLEWRRNGTPFDRACCGSVFKNPADAPADDKGPMTAGRLVEAAGLKGVRVGGAQVSNMHANYIVNIDNATADNVLELIEIVRAKVNKEFAVELDLEVKVIPSA